MISPVYGPVYVIFQRHSHIVATAHDTLYCTPRKKQRKSPIAKIHSLI
jgi:hypothetical protein